MDYGITHERKRIVLSRVENWYARDDLHSIAVDVIQSTGRREQHEVAVYTHEELPEAADELLELVIGEHGGRGGKLQLRAIFSGEDGQPQHTKSLRCTLQLTRLGVGERTGSKGLEGAAEAGYRSLTQGLDSVGRRLEHSHDATIDAIKEGAVSQNAALERLVAIMATHGTTTVGLERQLAILEVSRSADVQIYELRRELDELRGGLWGAVLTPEVIASVVPAAIAGLSTLGAAFVRALTAWAAAQTPTLALAAPAAAALPAPALPVIAATVGSIADGGGPPAGDEGRG